MLSMFHYPFLLFLIFYAVITLPLPDWQSAMLLTLWRKGGFFERDTVCVDQWGDDAAGRFPQFVWRVVTNAPKPYI
jgi:hypothetical protein